MAKKQYNYALQPLHELRIIVCFYQPMVKRSLTSPTYVIEASRSIGLACSVVSPYLSKAMLGFCAEHYSGTAVLYTSSRVKYACSGQETILIAV
jgi:hypothetical protein